METREPEIWKPIPDYEGLYEISSWGNVKSLEKKHKSRYGLFLIRKPKILKPISVTNYLRCCLYRIKYNPDRKLIHRLVAENFVENPNNYLDVNHKNSDGCDNYYKNLEWVSVRENQSHKFLNMKTTSIYVGVSYDKSGKRKKRWQAQINIEGKNKSIGYFFSEKEARDAYINALKENGLTNKYATETREKS